MIEKYQEILSVLEKHSDIITDDCSIDIRRNLINRIALCEISKEFDIEIENKYLSPGWIKLSDYEHIGLFGEKYNRTISWSDDGSQPDDERLLRIGFSTGAYIFGECYPTETFSKFFNELKTYNPKYCDTSNHALYFTSKTAANVHKNLIGIFNKYKQLVSEEVKAQRVEKLKQELKSLQA